MTRRAIGDEGDGYLHCGYPNCGAQVPQTEWSKAAREGWFFSKDGFVILCPRHLTPGIIEWRAWKKAKAAERAEEKQVAAKRAKANTPAPPAVTWSGDDDHVRSTFPGLRKDRNRHEHNDLVEGGLFYHSHIRGSIPHDHGPRGGVRVPREDRAQ